MDTTRKADMSNHTGRICAALAACLLSAVAIAQDITQQELRSLDDQVQEIKSDVLNIASELNNLEERLLYPSNTQVVVFVALDGGEKFRLDAVEMPPPTNPDRVLGWGDWDGIAGPVTRDED